MGKTGEARPLHVIWGTGEEIQNRVAFFDIGLEITQLHSIPHSSHNPNETQEEETAFASS